MSPILPLNNIQPILRGRRKCRPPRNIRKCKLGRQKELPPEIERMISEFERSIKNFFTNARAYDKSVLLTARDCYVNLRNIIRADYMYSFCKKIEVIANNLKKNSEDLFDVDKQQKQPSVELLSDFVGILYSEISKIASCIAKKEEDIPLLKSLKRIIQEAVHRFEDNNDFFHVLARYRDFKDVKGCSCSDKIKLQKKIIQTEEKILEDYQAAITSFRSFVREPMTYYEVKKLYAHDLEWLGELYKRVTPPKKRKIIQTFKRAKCIYRELGIKDRVNKMDDFIAKYSDKVEANEYYKREDI